MNQHLGRRLAGKRVCISALGAMVLLAILAGCGGSDKSSQTDSASTGAAPNGGDQLVAAARKEGTVTIYSSLTQTQNDALTSGFQKTYPGVKLQIVRPGAGSEIQTRVATEESAGQHNVDVILLGDNPCPFVTQHMSWFQSWSSAGLPQYSGFSSDQKRWLRDCGSSYEYPVLGVTEWGIAYNTDMIKTPPTWQDLVQPQYAGKVLLPDPRVADAYYDFWYLMLKTYGPGFLEKVAKNAKLSPGGIQAGQQVAAGSARAVIPSHNGVVTSVKNGTNAPIAISVPSPTVGLEVNAVLMASDRLPHPSAARLVLNYLLTKDANEAVAGDAATSIYDRQKLKGYRPADNEAALKAKNQILSALGLH